MADSDKRPRGAPPGNSNARSGSDFRQGLRRALKRLAESTGTGSLSHREGIDQIADALVAAAAAGSSWAIKEVADRTDGKAHQSISVSEADEDKRLLAEEHLWGICYPDGKDNDDT